MVTKYYPQLDGLRAIAVLTVMTGHFCPYPTINNLVGWGDAGVVIFFCLSGFLITGILLDLKDSQQSRFRLLVTFYTRRVLRIFPIYYLTIAIGVLVGSVHVIANLPWLLTYTANYVPGLPSSNTSLGPLSHVWSLSIEEQFYVGWPALIFLVPKRFLPALLIAVVGSSAIFKLYYAISGGSYSAIFRSVFSCMDSLGAGGALALARPILPRMFGAFGTRLLAFSIASVALSTIARFWVDADPWYRGHELLGVIYFQSIILLSCVVIMAGVSGKGWLLASVLQSRVLVSIGRISYGLYLYHFTMPYIAPAIVPHFIYSRFPISTIIALSFTVSALSWIAIEKPILSAKRYFFYRKMQLATES